METETFTAFRGTRRIAQGSRAALEAELAPLGPHPEGLLVFSDATGRETDLNLTAATPRAPVGVPPAGARKRGRPKLGVTAREVTLLPRHWDWLARQRGGASAALRRLVAAQMASDAAAATPEAMPDAAYAFLAAIGGNLPGYEAAIRALFAGDRAGFARAMADWPEDIRAHALTLARLP